MAEEKSNFSSEIEVLTSGKISSPLNFTAKIFPPKVLPLSAKLEWNIDDISLRPDHWVIEKKTNERNDTFKIVAKVYFQTEYFDRNLKVDTEYIYRITSYDVFGNKTDFTETRLNT